MLLRNRSRFVRILLAVGFCLGCAAEGSAQTARTRGWTLGLDSGATTVSFGSDPGDGAVLVGVRMGHGLNRIVTPYLGMGYGTIDSHGIEAFDKVKLGHVDIGARLHLAAGRRRWIPYGDLALTFWLLTDVLENGEWTSTDFTSRPTPSVGGGLAIYLSEAWALDVNIKAGKGRFQDVPVDSIPKGGTSRHLGSLLDLDAASVRVGVGVSWWW
ncbi:MAG: outer membrane beta-barrel protein [Acidobacteria bacterium]|nr:outer membrane beta-barrel protein [Acidobacteriota bacterium]